MNRVTQTDVAEAAGVSRALVSLAYRNAFGVSERTQARIIAVGDDLGYVHDQVAARLASRGSTSIGVHLQDLHNDFFAGVHDGIREVTEGERHDLVLAVGSRTGERDASSLRTLQGARVGVVISAGLLMPDVEVHRFAARIPLVSVARLVDGVDSVSPDNLMGAQLAVEHLLELGHRDIVFLANPPSDGYLDRGRGYERTMRRASLDSRSVQVTYAREDSAAAAADLLDTSVPPTAFFAHNDQAALGVLDTLYARGLRPGQDVSVVGYDNTSVSRVPGTSLTTVDLHGEDLGRAAASAALARLREPQREPAHEIWTPNLMVRATTGPVPVR